MKRNFKQYGTFDISGFKKIFKENYFDWEEFDLRQNRGQRVHRETKTIPIIFDESFSIKKYTKTKHYPLFENEIQKLEQHLNEQIGEEGFIFRAIIVKLPAKKEIRKHIDGGVSLTIPKRIHIAIETNPECIFSVGQVDKNLKEGEVWEINNDGRRHGVVNGGDTDRLHLIVDWMKKSDFNGQ